MFIHFGHYTLSPKPIVAIYRLPHYFWLTYFSNCIICRIHDFVDWYCRYIKNFLKTNDFFFLPIVCSHIPLKTESQRDIQNLKRPYSNFYFFKVWPFFMNFSAVCTIHETNTCQQLNFSCLSQLAHIIHLTNSFSYDIYFG